MPIPGNAQTKFPIANQHTVWFGPEQKALVPEVVGTATEAIVDGNIRSNDHRAVVVIGLVASLGQEVAHETGEHIIAGSGCATSNARDKRVT